MEKFWHHLTTITAYKLVLAAVLGAIVGVERELRGKSAGLRTHILIAMGAALFTSVSIEMAGQHGDPTRIAAQVVTGVGFIGAGVILRDHGAVVGLTTAASVFVVAAIGVAVGAGLLWPAVVASTVLLGTLAALAPVERMLRKRAARKEQPSSPEP